MTPDIKTAIERLHRLDNYYELSAEETDALAFILILAELPHLQAENERTTAERNAAVAWLRKIHKHMLPDEIDAAIRAAIRAASKSSNPT